MISYESKIRAQCILQYGEDYGNEMFDLIMESSKILVQLANGESFITTPQFLRQGRSQTGLHALDLAKPSSVIAKGKPQI